VNDILDQLERDNFVNAHVCILPPENGESDGDSENCDDEQSVARPFADHSTPRIWRRKFGIHRRRRLSCT